MIGLVGAGAFGWNHVRVGSRLGMLQAVAELSPTLREKLQQEYPALRVVETMDELLAEPTIRGVILATPAPSHFALARQALLAGKDVLVEKPLTLDPAEARELVLLAKQQERILMVGHLLYFKPVFPILRDLLHSGQLGQIRHIEMRRLKLGKVRREENVLWSFAPHDIAVLLGLATADLQAVKAWGKAELQPGIADNARLDLSFADGMTAAIHSSWLWPEDERKTLIIGENAMLVYQENQDRLFLHDKRIDAGLNACSGEVTEIPLPTGDALENEWRHFAECIEKRLTPLTDGGQGERVVAILSQASEQLQEKKKEYFVHESAYVDEPCRIGKGTQIWHFTHIMKNSEIGENCRIGQNVIVATGVKVGNGVKIQNNVSVYEGVELEDYVFCGPSMVFTNVRTPRSEFPRNTSADYARTLVKRGASIGANATIVCGTTIGERAFIGAGAVVTKDVPDYAVVHGNPATVKGWACACGDVFIKKNERRLNCARCGTDRECGE